MLRTALGFARVPVDRPKSVEGATKGVAAVYISYRFVRKFWYGIHYLRVFESDRFH